MNFIKKIFGKKDNHETGAEHDTFMCENCGKERDMSQKKVLPQSAEQEKKNVCEYC